VNSDYSNYRFDLFVGRERELKFLGELFNLSLENRGSFVLIEGETGIGKTRLTEELLKSIKFQKEPLIFPKLTFLVSVQHLDDRMEIIPHPKRKQKDFLQNRLFG